MTDTLSKFGVPLGSGAGRGGLLQPKHQNRFRVRVINFGPVSGGLELTQQVESCSRPKISYDEVQVDSYNSRAWFAGKHTWETVELVVKDDVTNSVSKLVGHQNQKQLNHFEQTSYLAGTNYKFTMIIENMDGGNDGILETWTLEGCWLSNITYSDLDYKDDAIQTITMTVRYDNATQSDGLMTTSPESISGTTV